MRFENEKGPKKKGEKKTHFINWKAYFSCYFLITPFHLHFKNDF
jgi:hypothetical protein